MEDQERRRPCDREKSRGLVQSVTGQSPGNTTDKGDGLYDMGVYLRTVEEVEEVQNRRMTVK